MAQPAIRPLAKRDFTSEEFSTALKNTIARRKKPQAQLDTKTEDNDWQDVDGEDDWQDVETVEETPFPAEEKKSSLSKFLEWGSAPLTDAPSRFARSVSQDWDLPTKEGKVHPLAAFGTGAIQGLGDVVSGFTSPFNLAATAFGGGAFSAARRGMASTANALRQATRASSVPVALHGYETLRDPEADTINKLFAVAELAGGAAGTYFPKSALPTPKPRPKPNIPVVEPKSPTAPIRDTSSINPEISDTPIIREPSAEALAARPEENIVDKLFPGLEKREPRRRLTFDEVNQFLIDEEGSAKLPNFFQGEEDLGYNVRTNDPDAIDLGEITGRPIDLEQEALRAGADTAKPAFSDKARQFLADESGEFNPGALFRQPQSPLEVEYAFDWPGMGKEGADERMFHVRGGPEDRSTLSESSLRERGLNIPERPLNEFSPDQLMTIDEDIFGGTSPRFAERVPRENIPVTAQIPNEQAGFMGSIANFLRDESGELDLNRVIGEERSQRRVEPELIGRENREFIDNLPDNALSDFIIRQSNNRNYTEPGTVGRAMLDYARDVIDTRARTADDIESLGLANLTPEQASNAMRHYESRGRTDLVDYLTERYQRTRTRPELIEPETGRPFEPYEGSYPESSPESLFSKSYEFGQGGKTLDELEAAKQAARPGRLNKLIGEERAGQLRGGEKSIGFEQQPYRPYGGKRISKSSIKHWSEWGDAQIKDAIPDPARPGLSIEEQSGYYKDLFPDMLEITYRDAQGNPIGVLKTDMQGKGISTLAVKSDIGLRRGKVAFEMLKQAFDRGITEPSGATSDMTKNLIQRIKKLVNSESGEIDLDVIFNKINELIDSISGSKAGQVVSRFLRDESGEADVNALFPTQEQPNQPIKPPTKLLTSEQLTEGLPIQERKQAPQQEPSALRQAWDLPRGTMSVDLPFMTSAAFRQASPLAWTKGWFDAWGKAAKSFGSEGAYKAIMSDIENSQFFQPRYEPQIDNTGAIKGYKEKPSVAESIGLKMSDMKNITSREEQIRGSLAEKIPGWGKYIKSSNRAYTAFLNSLRKSHLEKMMSQADFVGGSNDMVLAKQMAEFINDATGRSSLKFKVPGKEFNFEKNAEVLANALWSPRLLASRMRMLNPMTYTGLEPQVRQEYIHGLMRSAATWIGFAGLASMAGAKVSLDPTNADFGKIRIGDTRIDPGAGFQQLLVFSARMAPKAVGEQLGFPTGRYTSSVTGKSQEYGKGFRPKDRGTIAEDFAASKLHPSLKLAWDLIRATKDKPVHLGDRVVQMVLPMMAQDIAEVMKGNPDLAVGMAPLSSVGFGTATYGGKDSLSEPVFTNSIEQFLGLQPKSLRGTVRGF